MRLVQLFASQHPGLRFQLFALSSEAILERLARNQLDLGLSYLERLNRDGHLPGVGADPHGAVT